MKTPNMTLMLAAGVAFSASHAAMAQYDTGDAWHRASDWVPGAVPGGTVFNPGPGFDGVGVWQYEYAQGGDGLSGDSPWYTQETTLLNWDNNWWGHGFGTWSKGNDANPPIRQGKMTHNLVGTIYDEAPIVRWMLPAGTPELMVDIDGQFDVLWTGNEFRGSDMDVELVIARESASGQFDVLFSDVLSKPTSGVSIGDTASSMVDLSDVMLVDGDSLVISGRGVSSVGWTEGRWLDISDDLTITVVPIPAPASLALLGLGGLAAVRRRR
ncbi:MAG: PEP-CTERM sorting domain-containing protein [Phycisphaerales bacterium]